MDVSRGNIMRREVHNVVPRPHEPSPIPMLIPPTRRSWVIRSRNLTFYSIFNIFFVASEDSSRRSDRCGHRVARWCRLCWTCLLHARHAINRVIFLP